MLYKQSERNTSVPVVEAIRLPMQFRSGPLRQDSIAHVNYEVQDVLIDKVQIGDGSL